MVLDSSRAKSAWTCQACRLTSFSMWASFANLWSPSVCVCVWGSSMGSLQEVECGRRRSEVVWFIPSLEHGRPGLSDSDEHLCFEVGEEANFGELLQAGSPGCAG